MADDVEKKLKAAEAELVKLRRKPAPATEIRYQSEIAALREEKGELAKKLKLTIKKHGIFKALVTEMENTVSPFDELPDARPSLTGNATVEEHLVMHLSDEHADEIVEPHKVGGLEKYNFQVALVRAERYVDTVLKWTQQTLANHRFPVLHILSYGDHTSGEIHGGTSRSEYKNGFRNALAIGQMQALMIRDLAPYFKAVKIYCVPGNHGRRSVKKDYDGAWDNWDYLISEIARLHCRSLKNVEFLIPDCFSINVDINGHGFGIAHGDDIKSWNSIPFYGIERKTRRLVSLNSSQGKHIRYFVFGHFHALTTSADLNGETIINGAWPATNAYSYESFSGFREPMQLLHGVHPDHGISWRLPVKLKDAVREKKGPQRYRIDLSDENGVAEAFEAGMGDYIPKG